MPISFEDARSLILHSVTPLGSEMVTPLAALNRGLAEDVHAPLDMPLWDNSAMDGFAVRSVDCEPGASLDISGYIPAGGRPEPVVTKGCAVKIMTGGPVPPGCDAVVPFEETGEREGTVTLHEPVVAGQHIRVRGEDVAAGDLVLPAGSVVRPFEISMLTSFCRSQIAVYRRPRVAILSTGDELAEAGSTLAPGQIVNSNSASLAAAVLACGAEPLMLGIARDNPESLREKLSAGLHADVLITSAGVSMGDRDFVRKILTELGVEQLFWKIDIKPGRPTAFGLRDGLAVFALPGNPVSSMITFEELVRPALLRMMGHRQVIRPYVAARLAHAVKKKVGRVQFLRVAVSREGSDLVASSSGDQNTGILKTMLRANGIAVLPAEADALATGSMVNVHLLDEHALMEEE